MKSNTILGSLAMAAALAGGAVPASAQPSYGYGSNYSGTWDRDAFWRGAPDGLQQRIDWLQQRIDRGMSDGSLSREDGRRAQWELNRLRSDANALQQRLDNLSRSIRWARQDGAYGGSYGSG